jgi:hypothetical protein
LPQHAHAASESRKSARPWQTGQSVLARFPHLGSGLVGKVMAAICSAFKPDWINANLVRDCGLPDPRQPAPN